MFLFLSGAVAYDIVVDVVIAVALVAAVVVAIAIVAAVVIAVAIVAAAVGGILSPSFSPRLPRPGGTCATVVPPS